MILIAETPGWKLYQRHVSKGWRNLKLVKAGQLNPGGKTGRHTWWLSHNGERFARNGCAKHLAEEHSNIHDWVTSVLNQSAKHNPSHSHIGHMAGSAT
jgi:hypothetical protein